MGLRLVTVYEIQMNSNGIFVETGSTNRCFTEGPITIIIVV